MAEAFGSKFSSSQIREVRKQMGLSQKEVAALANVSRRTVQHAESRNSSVKLSSLQAIANVLDFELQGGESTTNAAYVPNVNSFGYLPFKMFKFLGARIAPNELAFCYCEREFQAILEILWQNFQRGLLNCCPSIAKHVTEQHPKFCNKAGYLERYLGIWRANPKAFSFSSTGGRRSGVSIVLPVSEHVFKEFIKGQRSNFEIQGDEIVGNSSTIIFESIALFSDSREKPHSIGGTLAFTAINQLANVLPYVRTNACEIGSFGAHAENIDRLQSVGFQPVGTKIPRLNFPIWRISNRGDLPYDEDVEVRSSTSLHFLSLKQKSQSIRAKLIFGAIAALQANRLTKGLAGDKKPAA